MQFHYGQRVRCIAAVDGNKWIIGQTGTICSTRFINKPGVLFDNAGKPGASELHECHCDDGSWVSIGVWNCYISALIPLEEYKSIGVEDFI